MPTTITPRLVVPDPDQAIQFYVAALGAALDERFTMANGTVVHAQLSVDGATFSLTAAVPDWGLLGPDGIGGTPVLLTMQVADARAVADRMVAAGATIVIPIEDRPYGRCEGRLQDPFGHLWIVGHVVEDLTDDEIQRRFHAD